VPILLLILLIVLIAQFGFWDTLQAILGGVLMLVLLGALPVGIAIIAVRLVMRRL
jgi:hypothetical protein